MLRPRFSRRHGGLASLASSASRSSTSVLLWVADLGGRTVAAARGTPGGRAACVLPAPFASGFVGSFIASAWAAASLPARWPHSGGAARTLGAPILIYNGGRLDDPIASWWGGAGALGRLLAGTGIGRRPRRSLATCQRALAIHRRAAHDRWRPALRPAAGIHRAASGFGRRRRVPARILAPPGHAHRSPSACSTVPACSSGYASPPGGEHRGALSGPLTWRRFGLGFPLCANGRTLARLLPTAWRRAAVAAGCGITESVSSPRPRTSPCRHVRAWRAGALFS